METVSTKRFWELMGDFRFVRMSRLTGKIGDKEYLTLSPPEDDPDFIADAIDTIKESLSPPTRWWTKFFRRNK